MEEERDSGLMQLPWRIEFSIPTAATKFLCHVKATLILAYLTPECLNL